MRDRRGLFCLDAFFAVTVVLLLSLSLMDMYEARRGMAERVGARLEAKLVGEKLAAAIHSVYAGGENSQLGLYLPREVNGFSYSVTFDNSTYLISVGGSDFGYVNVSLAPFCVGNFEFDPPVYVRIFWEAGTIRVENLAG